MISLCDLVELVADRVAGPARRDKNLLAVLELIDSPSVVLKVPVDCPESFTKLLAAILDPAFSRAISIAVPPLLIDRDLGEMNSRISWRRLVSSKYEEQDAILRIDTPTLGGASALC